VSSQVYKALNPGKSRVKEIRKGEPKVKSIKMFGLAALVALMAMAFVGASSAMAESTGLCGHDGTPCEAIHHVHETSVGKATLLSSAINVECNVLFLGDVTTAGSPLKISGNFTYSSCNSGCVVTEESAHSTIEVLKEGHETAKVTGEGLVHVNCSGFIDCSYNGTGLTGTAKGPLLSTQTNGEVSLQGQKTTKETGGFLCPKEAKLDIVTTSLWPTYLRSGVLGYCVETEHSTGLYTNSTCTTLGSPEGHSYKYALIFAPAGGVVGEEKCYGTLLPYGLWKDSACTEDNASNTSLYEKGIIKTVE
jgi:hypothetical protein